MDLVGCDHRSHHGCYVKFWNLKSHFEQAEVFIRECFSKIYSNHSKKQAKKKDD